MPGMIYGLCAFTALVCSVLLLRSYAQSKTRLLLWSGLCFVGLFLNNLLLVFDRLVFISYDLTILRLLPAVIGMILLVCGLIWEEE